MGREFDTEPGEGRGQCTADPYQLGADGDGRRLLKKIHDRCREDGDCWIWAQGVNSCGYPQFSHQGKGGQMVKRHVLMACGKKPIGKKNRATSICDKDLCVNPAHLKWTGFSDLLKEAYASGRRSTRGEYLKRVEAAHAVGLAKLDWDKVREIRRRCLTEGTMALAREYGVKDKAITNIKFNRSWRIASPWEGL